MTATTYPAPAPTFPRWWRWLGGTPPTMCESCRTFPAIIRITVDAAGIDPDRDGPTTYMVCASCS